MKTYAKLNEGALKLLERVPNISNATEEQFAEYAKDNGYKELRHADRPGRYYTQGYKETSKYITETWSPMPLDAAKQDALSVLQSTRDTRMNNVTIPCESRTNGILYNTEAMTMAQGLVILQSRGALPEGTTWTDAADEAHPVTQQLLDSIVQAMLIHVNTVQAAIQIVRDDVRNATDVDAVEEALGKLETLI